MTVSVRAQAWSRYDTLIDAATEEDPNPWVRQADGRVTYEPDFDLLSRLLAVPLELAARSQTGVPALALDVWTGHEFRRAGFDPDSVWPRASEPRVLTPELRGVIRELPRDLRDELNRRLTRGSLAGASSSTARVLGKNYVKQVDVVMSGWDTGPELMVSTKRMDSSFGKNAANRVEESYGDAKNLRLRHPRAALGFMYGLRSTALTQEPDKAEWLIDLLMKLGREDDAYDAVALIIPRWSDSPSDDGLDDTLPVDEDALAAAGLWDDAATPGDAGVTGPRSQDSAHSGPTPTVELDHDAVPDELQPARFFAVMTRRVLDNCPVGFHKVARSRLSNPREL